MGSFCTSGFASLALPILISAALNIWMVALVLMAATAANFQLVWQAAHLDVYSQQCNSAGLSCILQIFFALLMGYALLSSRSAKRFFL